MRSHAEYLAAEELSGQSVERVKQLAFFEDDTPNDSWLNTISYLVEMHPGVRRYFLNNHPEWMLASWPSAFAPEEKHLLVQNLLAALSRSDQYLVNHPTVKLWQVAKFLTELDRTELGAQLDSENSAESANAMVLLSNMDETSILPRARAIIKETKRADYTRYSAIICLINLKDRASIDELIGILDRDDPYYASVLDLIGAVSDPEDLPKVLPVILNTNVGLSSTHLRFREFVSATAVRVALTYLLRSPSTMASFRSQSYLDPMIEAVPEYWDAEIARLSAELLITLEANHVYPQPSELTSDFMKAVAMADKNRTFLQQVLAHYVVTATEPHFYAHWLGSQLTVEIAEWLVQSKATRLIQRLSPSIFDENVRQVLKPAAGGYIEAQEENWRQYEREERKRKEKQQTEKEAVQQVLLTEMDFGRVVTKFYQTKPEYWPDLPGERAEWILREVSGALTSLDLEKNIFMGEGTSWSSPTWLRVLLSLTDHYNFAVPNDVELIKALRAWPETAIVNHYRRYGISAEAAQKLESMLRDEDLHEHMLSNVLSFLEQTGYRSAALVELLKELIGNGRRSESLRSRAIDLIGADPESTRFLASLYKETINGTMRDRLFVILVQKQYRPVVEASLSALLTDDNALREAESGSHIPYDESPVLWITKVQMPEVWNKLKHLRRRTLELALPNLCGLVTQTLRKLDLARLPSLVRTQVVFAPPAWIPQQKALAIEYEREARIVRAKSTPFETVLAKLKVTSSMLALRVWCEGKRDREILRALLRELGENELANSVRLVGGWSNFLAEDEPDQWLTGCRRAVFIMDGDNGRNMSDPNSPYSDEAKAAFRRFEGHALKLYVLERHGIEHYIPRTVYEKLLGRDLTAFFPLPPTVSVEDHFVEEVGGTKTRFYSKSMNSQVAALITMKDIAGTDLERILLEIREQSRRLAR
jgi:HEAT repeat protein